MPGLESGPPTDKAYALISPLSSLPAPYLSFCQHNCATTLELLSLFHYETALASDAGFLYSLFLFQPRTQDFWNLEFLISFFILEASDSES